jgi:hypothetical protein
MFLKSAWLFLFLFICAVENNLFQKHMVRGFDLFQQQQQLVYNYSSI